ncbi:MAG: hypothetical protein M0Z41_03015 [Peptococcaceae bacterium]|jgi:hypothetical protein|nr:hypothetical protein [Peptococcaceae bacterium]
MVVVNLGLLSNQVAGPAREDEFKAAVLTMAGRAEEVELRGIAPTFLYMWAASWLKDAGVKRLWTTSTESGPILIFGGN